MKLLGIILVSLLLFTPLQQKGTHDEYSGWLGPGKFKFSVDAFDPYNGTVVV